MGLLSFPSKSTSNSSNGDSSMRSGGVISKWKRKFRKTRSNAPGSFGSTSSSSSSDLATTPKSVLLRGAADDCWLPSTSTSAAASSLPKFTRSQLEQVLRRLGAEDEDELEAVLVEADGDGDGVISVEDLLRRGPVAEEIEEEEEEEELRVAFGVYDLDGDGRISAEELRRVLVMLGDEGCSIDDCRRMIGGVDSDGDGFVCFRDFQRMMRSVSG